MIDLSWLNTLIALAVVLALLWPLAQRRLLVLRRAGGMERLGRARGSRAIGLIARRETYRLLGFPLIVRDTIDPTEEVLRTIARTPPRTPIDLVVHIGPGEMVGAEQIAHALVRHSGRVTVFVPYSAMESALLIALAADEIVIDPNAVLGPVVPRVGPYPAVSLLRAAQERGAAQLTDEILTLTDQAQKATAQVRALVRELLLVRNPERETIDDDADHLAGIVWTPHYPILLEEAQRLGLPVSDALPPEVHSLMELYDTSAAQRASTAVVRVGQ